MKKILLLVGGGFFVSITAPLALGWAVLAWMFGSLNPAQDAPHEPSAAASTDDAGTTAPLPPAMRALYKEASGQCPGLSWTVLAAIGTVESGNGTSTLPGVHFGANYAGAEGPMQFEPTTFAEYALPVPPGGVDPPSPYDAVDSVYAAARLLCASGGGDPSHLAEAVFSYNHSETYVRTVLSLSGQLQAEEALGGVVSGAPPDGGG